MRIKKFTDSKTESYFVSDSYKKAKAMANLYYEVRDTFSYVIDEFKGRINHSAKSITIIFDLSIGDRYNILDSIKYNKTKLELLESLDESLNRLAIYSDIYYSLTSSHENVILSIKIDGGLFYHENGFRLLQKKV